jgi:hypothetical protein
MCSMVVVIAWKALTPKGMGIELPSLSPTRRYLG